MIVYYLKYILSVCINFILRITFFIPIHKNKIVFESFGGKQLACNPYYIYQYLIDAKIKFNYIWCYNATSKGGIRCVKKNSFAYFYHLLTANVYITNNGIPSYIPFRESQLIIDTWHGGGAYKKVGNSITNNSNWYEKKIQQSFFRTIPYYLSSSTTFTEISSVSFNAPKEKFLPFGMPRNDVFFSDNVKEMYNEKVRLYFKLDVDTFIVLYAPTYRSNPQNSKFDMNLNISSLISSIQGRFNVKKVCVMFRSHHTINEKYQINDCLNVSDYEYMQELLCAADMLISDYSSCIWDYSFTYRPCFLFIPDLQEYKLDRDFYFPIESWGFPIAHTNQELQKVIQNFNITQFAEAMKRHHETLGSYESGKGAKLIGDFILSKI